ncbi:MAG: cobalamin-independent methionine synthase II family protein [Alphaproteobacteria bacterium]|nr:cobalamin-independent methionine synthase II family protein [Alphaproteobacteria bacterium]
MAIRTTHVGSLPRSALVADLLFGAEKGLPFEPAAWQRVMDEGTAALLARQKQAGIDIPSDGETSKISYATYIKDRLTGFEGDSPRSPPADLEDFPGFLEKLAKAGGTPTYRRPRCTGPITVKNLEPLHKDIAAMKAGMAAAGYSEGFMNSASPGVIALFQPSDYHKTLDDYLFDLAEAMRAEYEAIVAAGLILQIDAPDLGLGRHMMYKGLDEAGFLKRAAVHIEAINHGLRNIPRDRVRMHICWGNYEGPHTRDISLGAVLPELLKAKPGALLFEGANPRHAHEWTVWHEAKVPDDLVLIPGCLDSTSNFVEHPELIAQRLANYLRAVGPDRVIAGTDCGFSTFAGFGVVDPGIVWAKFEALAQGAALATRRA